MEELEVVALGVSPSGESQPEGSQIVGSMVGSFRRVHGRGKWRAGEFGKGRELH